MPIRITKATDPIIVDRITMCLYSVPGIGKTTVAFTADQVLLLDFDHGAQRTKNRKDAVVVNSWDDVLAMRKEDLEPYKTVAIDTAGRALDCLTQKIIEADPKMGRGGALTLQGFGRLKAEFVGWITSIRAIGLDVVLLCHLDEQKKGDDIIERLDVQGGSKNEIYKSADVMGRLYLQGGKRWLNFSPTDTSFGKNPAGLPPIEVPPFSTHPEFLGVVISSIKAKLNEASVAQAQAVAALEAWAEKVGQATDAPSLSALISMASMAPDSIKANAKRALVKRAGDLGFILSEDKTAFVSKEPDAAA